MSEGGSHDGSIRKRKMLCDITNSHVKWGFPLGQGKFVIGNEISRQKENLDNGIEDVNFGQLVHGGLNGSTKGKETISGALPVSKTYEGDTRKCLSISDDVWRKGMSFVSPSSTCKSMVLDSNGEPTQFGENLDTLHANSKMKELSNTSNSGVSLMTFNATSHGTTEAEWFIDGRTSGVSSPVPSKKVRNSSPVVEKGREENFRIVCGDVKAIRTEAIAGDKHEKELHSFSTLTHCNLELENLKKNNLSCIGNFIHESLRESCTEGSFRPSSSKMLSSGELETTHSSIREHVVNVEDGLTSPSACSCSFCLKAAYILTDLLYQDVKGRLAELKKRTKEARILGGKNYSMDSTDKRAENSNNFPKLEFDFLQHWRPVFLKTENILTQEIDKLKSSLCKLKELREKCKRDAEIDSTGHSN